MSLESRISLLEKIVGDTNEQLVVDIMALDAQVNDLLAQYKAQNLDFNALARLLPSHHPATVTPHLSREAKVKVIEARAAEILAQTSMMPSELRVPPIDPVDLGTTRDSIEECIHEFDETSQRSIHLARIYLDGLQSAYGK